MTVDLRGLNPTQNPYEVLLYNGTTNATGQASGTLSSEFYTVDNAWRSIITPLTTSVSMSISATHTEVVNGTLYGYYYFNNLPFNPRAPPAAFNVSVFFDWSRPFLVSSIPLASLSITHCPPTTQWRVVNQTSPTGPLPVAMGNLTYLQSSSSVNYQVSYSSSRMNLAFNSNDWESSASYVGMSTAPAWNGTDTNGVADIDSAYSSDALPWGMIYLDNVTFHVVNSELYLYTGTYPSCYWADEGVYRTQMSVSNVNATSFVFKAVPVNPAWGTLLAKFFKFSPLTKMYEGPGGTSVKLYSVVLQATGYTNAQDALNRIVGAKSYFDAALSLGLAAADALSWLRVGSVAADVAESVNLIASAVGYATAVYSAMATISFSVTATNSIELVSYSVYGAANANGLYLNFYQATQNTDMSTSGGTYVTQMPPVYVIATQS